MIRRLVLRNWRNYADLDLELGPGTTFIVAPNGVGKTSLMEGASWAVFGAPAPGQRPGGAVRAGASHALAAAEVELPDHRVLAISRELPKKPGARAAQPTASLDGHPVSASQAASVARAAFGADLAFLARLAMPGGLADRGALSEFRLRDHLCEMFGVDRLNEAATELDARVRAQDKLIRQARAGAPADAGLLAGLRQDLRARQAAYAEAVAAHDQLTRRADQAREAAAARQRLAQWQDRARGRDAALAGLARRAAPDVALDPASPPGMLEALDAALTAASSDLEAVRLRRATLAGRAAALERHSATLDGAHGDCPVCRRPLSGDAAGLARSAHRGELAALRAEDEALGGAEARAAARRDRVRELAGAYRAVPDPGPRPRATPGAPLPGDPSAGDPSPDDPSPDDLSLDDLSAERERLFGEMVSLKAGLVVAERSLLEAEAGAAEHRRVEELYATDAVLRASRAAILATTAQVLDHTIEPLTAEVNARWQHLFPRRGRLRTASTGDVSREVNGEALPYSAFSTGERMGLVILLRLLVLEMATRASFCWFDEPLEHLDPDARRRVAEALARASTTGPLRQIVVTTYEEPLARRLRERHPGHVNLVYVRQGPDAAG